MVAPAESGIPAVRVNGTEAEAGEAKLYLLPGRIAVCLRPTAVTTILGSCVAVCLWDRRRRRGGMTHHLLPRWLPGARGPDRFGDVAVARLIDELGALGSLPGDLQAKLFGGADTMGGSRGDLGRRNLEVAREVLGDHGIPIVAESGGGHRGRKLIFHTGPGTAWLKTL